MQVSSVSNPWSYSGSVLPSELDKFTADSQQVQGVPYKGELIQVSSTARAMGFDQTPDAYQRELTRSLGAFGQAIDEYTSVAKQISRDLMIRLRRDNQDTETTQKTSDETGAAKKTWSKAEVSSDTETKKTWGKLEASSDTETKTTSSYGVTSNMQSSLSASTAKSTTQFASRSAESAYKLSATGYSAPKATVELLA